MLVIIVVQLQQQQHHPHSVKKTTNWSKTWIKTHRKGDGILYDRAKHFKSNSKPQEYETILTDNFNYLVLQKKESFAMVRTRHLS